MELKTITKCLLLFALFLYSYYIYEGIIHPVPALGDSFDYHIPIAKMILEGNVFSPQEMRLGQWYYPGSSNAFHSLFLFLHIPLTLSNLLPIFLLAMILYFVGKSFLLSQWSSMLFALSIISLTLFHRWGNAVSIDVWVAVFFAWCLYLLNQRKKTDKWFLYVGIATGMLIGSKYLAAIYPVILIAFYWKEFISGFSLKRIILFISPVLLLGGFWYMRNYLLIGNPFYPLSVLGFPGGGVFNAQDVVWRTMLSYPVLVAHAFFSEYKLFSLLFIPLPFMLLKQQDVSLRKLALLSLVILLFFLQFPMDHNPWIMVSSLRYSYPLGILLVLLLFLLAKKYKKEEVLGYISLASAFPVLTMAYYPKLILLVLPVFLLILYFLEPHLDKKN